MIATTISTDVRLRRLLGTIPSLTTADRLVNPSTAAARPGGSGSLSPRLSLPRSARRPLFP